MQLFNVYLWFACLVCTENKSYTIYVWKIHRAELTQAELTQGRVDSGADMTSGRVDPLPGGVGGGVGGQCSHSKFKLGVFIPPHSEIRGYEVKFKGMTF